MTKTLTQALVDALLAVLPVAISAVSAFAVRHLQALKKGHTFALLTNIAFAAVETAEEMGYGLGIKGQEKLAHAVTTLTDFAQRYNVHITTDQAHQLVLSALTEFRAVESAALGQAVPRDAWDFEEPEEALHPDPDSLTVNVSPEPPPSGQSVAVNVEAGADAGE